MWHTELRHDSDKWSFLLKLFLKKQERKWSLFTNYIIMIFWEKKDFYAKFIYVNTIEPGEEQYFIEETIAVLLLNTTFQNLF